MKQEQKRVGIIGASGFTGHELLKILLKHQKVKVEVLNSRSFAGKKVTDIYKEVPHDFPKDLTYTNESIEAMNAKNLDILFLALPHGHALELLAKINTNTKVIDLSADLRFSDMNKYTKVYGIQSAVKNTAVYGLPELFKEQIKHATIVANPGCYVTACILAAYPIQEFADYIIFDCKSGWSGAGRESDYAKNPTLLKENIIPYKITRHRHKYEIEQFIKTKLSFTPHVFDAFQGMLCTAHIISKKDAQKNLTTEKIQQIYKEFYKNKPFVKITEKIPTVRDTQKTNLCVMGGFEMDENGQLVIISSIDNLVKGAAGQAVQNMNIMFGFEETEGLT